MIEETKIPVSQVTKDFTTDMIQRAATSETEASSFNNFEVDSNVSVKKELTANVRTPSNKIEEGKESIVKCGNEISTNKSNLSPKEEETDDSSNDEEKYCDEKSSYYRRKRGDWTNEEDEVIRTWVKTKGEHSWVNCAKLLPGKRGKQCRERWHNQLNPKVMKKFWTISEDLRIFALYKLHGGSWTEITKHFKDRSDNQIKNRFYSTARKITFRKALMLESDGKGKRLRTTEITLRCPLMVEVIDELKNISTRGDYKSFLCRHLGEFSFHVKDDEGEDAAKSARACEITAGLEEKREESCEPLKVGFKKQYRLKVKKADRLVKAKLEEEQGNFKRKSQRLISKQDLKFEPSIKKKRNAGEFSCDSDQEFNLDKELRKREGAIKIMLADSRGVKLLDSILEVYNKNELVAEALSGQKVEKNMESVVQEALLKRHPNETPDERGYQERDSNMSQLSEPLVPHPGNKHCLPASASFYLDVKENQIDKRMSYATAAQIRSFNAAVSHPQVPHIFQQNLLRDFMIKNYSHGPNHFAKSLIAGTNFFDQQALMSQDRRAFENSEHRFRSYEEIINPHHYSGYMHPSLYQQWVMR